MGVLVAAEDIPLGTRLTESLLAIRDIPRAYVDGRYVRASESKKVIGGRVTAGLRANEALLWSDLNKFSGRAKALSGLVRPGMRAIALDGRTTSFDGLMRPGDRVDLLFSAGTDHGGTGETMTLLQNLLVMSVGGELETAQEIKTKDGTVHSAAFSFLRGGAVTVSATVEQAQVITQARLRGKLTLTLRNPDDVTIVEGLPATLASDLPKSKNRLSLRRAGTTPKTEGIEHVR
jgi:pilus assembly protein CpaB